MPPRIRTIKPEAMQHVKVGSLSHFAFRLWVGCITHADDDGRLVADARQLRAQFFAYHPRATVLHVEAALEEIAAAGLVVLYAAGERRLLHFPSWRAHQRIHKHHYTASRLPAPPPHEGAPEGTAVQVRDLSGTGTAGVEGKGMEWIGTERKGGEGNGEGRERAGGTPSPGPPSVAVACQGSNHGPEALRDILPAELVSSAERTSAHIAEQSKS
jgi:hypothetical protein